MSECHNLWISHSCLITILRFWTKTFLPNNSFLTKIIHRHNEIASIVSLEFEVWTQFHAVYFSLQVLQIYKHLLHRWSRQFSNAKSRHLSNRGAKFQCHSDATWSSPAGIRTASSTNSLELAASSAGSNSSAQDFNQQPTSNEWREEVARERRNQRSWTDCCSEPVYSNTGWICKNILTVYFVHRSFSFIYICFLNGASSVRGSSMLRRWAAPMLSHSLCSWKELIFD